MTNFLVTGCWLLNGFQENCFKWCEHTELGPIMFDPNFIVMFKILSGNMPVQLQVFSSSFLFQKKYRVFPLYFGQSSIKWLLQMSSSNSDLQHPCQLRATPLTFSPKTSPFQWNVNIMACQLGPTSPTNMTILQSHKTNTICGMVWAIYCQYCASISLNIYIYRIS